MLGVGTGLGLLTLSDAFLYLTLQRRTELGTSWFPLLFVGTALVFLLLAVPVGRLADRVGRARVFLGGHLLLLAGYAVLLAPGPDVVRILALLGLLGAFYAATAGVLMAMASAVIPDRLRAGGLALVTAAVAVSKLGASLLFGGLWSRFGSDLAVIAFVAGLAVAVAGAGAVLSRHRPAPA